MSSLLFLAAAAAASTPGNATPYALPPSPDIVVTASLEPVPLSIVPESVTTIDQQRIDALALPLATDLLRLVPGVAVSTSGGRGQQAQLRIRGNEANHTLLFIDGLAFNDIAAGNEARFETLISEGLGRIEVITGPQSALYGSEALGGVVSLESPDPIGARRLVGASEYGSRDFQRGTVSGSFGSDRAGVSASASYLHDDGIDVLGGGVGDRDGYRNYTASLKAVTRPGENGELGIAGRYIDTKSQFDGTDPVTFLRADTRDNSHTRTGGVRVWARYGLGDAPWSIQTDAQYLHSENENFDGDAALNRTSGSRFRVGGQSTARFAGQTLVARIEREDERFSASDVEYGGFTDQRQTRGRTAFVGEWLGRFGDRIATDLAVRHDSFNRFADATTFRAGAVVRLVGGLSVYGNYGRGIAQPTFYDLYGFFPGSFVGNPALKPERSRGFEGGLRFTSEQVTASLAAYRSQLHGEIVSTFDPATFLSSTANATGRSRRNGVEAAVEVRPTTGLRVGANYTYTDSRDQQVADTVRVREVRRPKHAANLYGDWTSGRFTLGGALSYIGRRRDTDFDQFPAPTVILSDYLLASASAAFRVTGDIEAFARVENAGDAHYQDVVGYRVPGRTVFGGIRLSFGD